MPTQVMDKIHKINIEMVREIDEICKRHDIQYFIAYGSLLGAVRHQGPIPWDNDVDIWITRDEYLKFRNYKDEIDSAFYFVEPEDVGKDKYFDSVPRLIYKNLNINISKEENEYYNDLVNKLSVDFFFLDRTNSKLSGKLQRIFLAMTYALMNAYRHSSAIGPYKGIMKPLSFILQRIGRKIPLPKLRDRARRISEMFKNNENGDEVFTSNGSLKAIRKTYKSQWFSQTLILKYADISVPVPYDYDSILISQYGNYMEYPPKEEQCPHWGSKGLDEVQFEEIDKVDDMYFDKK